MEKNTTKNTNVGHQMQGHRPRPDKVSQYCFDLASSQSSIQKSCQNAAENFNLEENCETTATAASSTEKTCQKAAENSGSKYHAIG